jgi:hypothetical protein
MNLPRLNLWMLCLAVAASAFVIKLALILGVLLTFTMPLIFLGPLSGIVLERHRGGTGIAGGVVAGILSGFALSAFMNIYIVNLGRPFSWFELTVSTAAFVILEAFCGWIWGRSYRAWHSSMANRTAADPKGDGT